MTLLYAATFSDALAKLNAQEQKQAKITMVDLALDPKGGGLSLERLNTGDKHIWSARVSQDIRIILRRDGDALLLAYVGHHDDAYRWAERRRIEPHERTGAMQIVEVVEAREELARSKVTEAQPVDGGRGDVEQPFWALSDDQMLDVGVPREWIEPIRNMTEDGLDGLFDKLPGEAAEALLDFATGGRLEDHVAGKSSENTDPFLHPDAQRRFRVVENVEELQAALDLPFEKWAVFLHPAQRELVEQQWRGPVRVSGSAGTGKTIVAIHRAAHLARKSSDMRVLLTTFSKPLVQSLLTKLRVLEDISGSKIDNVDVATLDSAAIDLFTTWFRQPNLATPSQIRAAIADARRAGLASRLSEAFLFEEWDELVDAWGVETSDKYAKLPRIGRKTRLGGVQREEAWAVFEFIRRRLADRSLITLAQIYRDIGEAIGRRKALPFSHVVVDEAQDLSVAQVGFLAKISKSRPDAAYLCGDVGQRIFHLPFSWLQLGLDIRGRSHALKVNYRTSHQIRVMADRLLPAAIVDLDGISEDRKGTVSTFDGPSPEIMLCDDEKEETALVAQKIRDWISQGVEPANIGVLVRSQGQLNRARQALKESGFDVRADGAPAIRCMHDAKGLEFGAVAVMACDEDVLPDPSRIASVADLADIEAANETERHLLYVACTRARDHLLVSGIRPGSEFVEEMMLVTA